MAFAPLCHWTCKNVHIPSSSSSLSNKCFHWKKQRRHCGATAWVPTMHIRVSVAMGSGELARLILPDLAEICLSHISYAVYHWPKGFGFVLRNILSIRRHTHPHPRANIDDPMPTYSAQYEPAQRWCGGGNASLQTKVARTGKRTGQTEK